MTDAYLSLGGNLGDRKGLVDAAVLRLCSLPATRLIARSSYYRTEPVGPVAQAWFLNIIVGLRTELDAAALREACRSIETALGRRRAAEVAWGPRPIDIDVIAFGEDSPPHKELSRGYVIVPLAEIAPTLTIAGQTVALYLAQADVAGVARLDWAVPGP